MYVVGCTSGAKSYCGPVRRPHTSAPRFKIIILLDYGDMKGPGLCPKPSNKTTKSHLTDHMPLPESKDHKVTPQTPNALSRATRPLSHTLQTICP